MAERDEQHDGSGLDYEAPTLTEFGRVEEFTHGIGISIIIDIFP